MKKILVAIVALFCFISAHSQTLTANTTSIPSGGYVVLTASGESFSTKYFTGQTSNSITGADSHLAQQQIFFRNQTSYTPTNPVPSTYTFQFINNSDVPVTVTFQIVATEYDVVAQTYKPNNIFNFTVTVAAGSGYGNAAQTVSFSKNDCAPLNTGSVVTYTVPVNTFHSFVSQADANQQALASANSNGQAYANANGFCTATDPTPYIQLTGPSTIYQGNTQIITYSISLTGPFANVAKNVGWLQMPQGWNVGLIKGSFIAINPSPNAVSGTVTAQVYINGQWYNKSMYVTASNQSPIQP